MVMTVCLFWIMFQPHPAGLFQILVSKTNYFLKVFEWNLRSIEGARSSIDTLSSMILCCRCWELPYSLTMPSHSSSG